MQKNKILDALNRIEIEQTKLHKIAQLLADESDDLGTETGNALFALRNDTLLADIILDYSLKIYLLIKELYKEVESNE